MMGTSSYKLAKELKRQEVTYERLLVSVPFPEDLILTPVSRWPLELDPSSLQIVMSGQLPETKVTHAHRATVRQCLPTSIVIVTYNNLVYTRMCVESLLANTDHCNYELIVVDNNSTDETKEYLNYLAKYHSHIKIIYNETNRGFAAANNQGLSVAKGEFLVLLNNDTIVPSGWLQQLLKHLQDQNIGIVGPVTNRTGNEAQIEVPYHTYGELVRFAQTHIEKHKDKIFDIRTLNMFCVAMRRQVFETVGPLDEQFEIGLFEDDDYSLRVHTNGYRVLCAEDAFVHHFGQASIGKLATTGEYGKIFHANRKRFENKWGIQWTPHKHRTTEQYQHLTEEIQQIVHSSVPQGSTIMVVNKGDEALLELGARTTWHFPRMDEENIYAGYYPANSYSAISHLESLRKKGGNYLLLPRTAFWWLDHYKEFEDHLRNNYKIIIQHESCMIFGLG
jgi:GT2 family glycosyltransferase